MTEVSVRRYGVLNAAMFGRPSAPGEYVNWSEPDILTEDDLIWLGLGDAASLAAGAPHLIVFELEAGARRGVRTDG